MKSKKPTKSRAQAMVEFAIALPMLLLLLYGILEVGRLLFLYSTVVTASRQAARYGSTTGEGIGGAIRYNDCDGIRNAANQVGYLGDFDTINIQWDKGPNDPDADKTYCPVGTPKDNISLSGNDNRIIVTVVDQFVPIVKLVPLSPRTISATSSRTVITGVPIVVDQPDVVVIQEPTITTITADTPDPSEMNQTVTVFVEVVNANDANKTPTGTVLVNGGEAGITCTITLTTASDGKGSCTITYTTVGNKTIGADFMPDDDIHLASSAISVPHMVSLADTVTAITPTSPDPSQPGNTITVVVTVTGGTTKPTGTVDVSAGGNIKCTITLANGAGSCPLTFSKTGNYNITADYSGDSTHNPSSDNFESHEVLQGTPTPTVPPTATLPFTPTIPPTATPVPPTVLPPGACKVTYGLLQKSGNDLTISLNNQSGLALEISNIFFQWNHDKGHQTGADKSLKLQSASLAGATTTTFYTGPNPGPSLTINTPYPVVLLPTGTYTVVFTFHQSFDNWDGTEQIDITFANLGCSKITQAQH